MKKNNYYAVVAIMALFSLISVTNVNAATRITASKSTLTYPNSINYNYRPSIQNNRVYVPNYNLNRKTFYVAPNIQKTIRPAVNSDLNRIVTSSNVPNNQELSITCQNSGTGTSINGQNYSAPGYTAYGNWIANVTGGNGNNIFSWQVGNEIDGMINKARKNNGEFLSFGRSYSETQDGISNSNISYFRVAYNTVGQKNASVSVTSNGQTASAMCSPIVVTSNSNSEDLAVSCVHDNNGTQIVRAGNDSPRGGYTNYGNWIAKATGGANPYNSTGGKNDIYTFAWQVGESAIKNNGELLIPGNKYQSTVVGNSPIGTGYFRVAYNTEGTKNATVTVTSRGKSVTASCAPVTISQ